jgi:hypothetical protein
MKISIIFLACLGMIDCAFAGKHQKSSDDEKEEKKEPYKTKPAIRKPIKPEKSDAPRAYQKRDFYDAAM